MVRATKAELLAPMARPPCEVEVPGMDRILNAADDLDED